MAIFSSCTLAHLLFATAALFFRLYLLLPFSFLLAFRHSASVTSCGPPTYPIFGCLVSFYKNRKRLLDWYTELLAVSPTQTIVISRLGGRRTVVTANPNNIEYILKSNFKNFPKGKPFTEILGDLLGHGIFNVDGELWYMQRKLASHEFTAKSLREFLVQTLEIEVEERLLPILSSAAKDGRVVDLQELLKRFAFDIVSKVSLGMDPAYLDSSLPISNFASAFDVASMISARRAAAPIFAIWKVKRALNLGSERQLKEAIKEIHVSVTELINSRRAEKEGKERSDLLSRLISAVDDEELIRDMVISFIMAGRDTTSSAMTWLFWLLSSHEELEKEIIEEVKTVTSKGGERLNYENLKEMRVVKACLCESMRLYPPVAWDSKHAAEEDRLPDGTRVERGDRVTYFPYGMGRMKGVWGEDCEVFKPQRWLESEESISPYKFPVFQAGPRVCLGKEMAFIQMKYVVAAILRRFEVRAVCEESPVFLPLLTAHMAGGFKVVIRERNLQ